MMITAIAPPQRLRFGIQAQAVKTTHLSGPVVLNEQAPIDSELWKRLTCKARHKDGTKPVKVQIPAFLNNAISSYEHYWPHAQPVAVYCDKRPHAVTNVHCRIYGDIHQKMKMPEVPRQLMYASYQYELTPTPDGQGASLRPMVKETVTSLRPLTQADVTLFNNIDGVNQQRLY